MIFHNCVLFYLPDLPYWPTQVDTSTCILTYPNHIHLPEWRTLQRNCHLQLERRKCTAIVHCTACKGTGIPFGIFSSNHKTVHVNWVNIGKHGWAVHLQPIYISLVYRIYLYLLSIIGFVHRICCPLNWMINSNGYKYATWRLWARDEIPELVTKKRAEGFAGKGNGSHLDKNNDNHQPRHYFWAALQPKDSKKTISYNFI